MIHILVCPSDKAERPLKYFETKQRTVPLLHCLIFDGLTFFFLNYILLRFALVCHNLEYYNHCLLSTILITVIYYVIVLVVVLSITKNS
jgi:uncharacterized protein YbaR (Trm112 family)